MALVDTKTGSTSVTFTGLLAGDVIFIFANDGSLGASACSSNVDGTFNRNQYENLSGFIDTASYNLTVVTPGTHVCSISGAAQMNAIAWRGLSGVIAVTGAVNTGFASVFNTSPVSATVAGQIAFSCHVWQSSFGGAPTSPTLGTIANSLAGTRGQMVSYYTAPDTSGFSVTGTGDSNSAAAWTIVFALAAGGGTFKPAFARGVNAPLLQGRI